jgi:ABC-2 type transport system ATP-binding protein
MKQRVKLAQALVQTRICCARWTDQRLDPGAATRCSRCDPADRQRVRDLGVVCSHLCWRGGTDLRLTGRDRRRPLLRADRISAMTEARDVLVVEVAEGTEELEAR